MAAKIPEIILRNATLSNGVTMFYREAGSPLNPTIVLLHGFPSSSHQYRLLIPLLAFSFHVIAPDYPGFGFTIAPSDFSYTFSSLADTFGKFLEAIHVVEYAAYIFDYGAPVFFRHALQHPSGVTAIIVQNGNAYKQGLGQTFWAPLEQYWASVDPKTGEPTNETKAIGEQLREAVITDPNGTKSQYTIGTPAKQLSQIAPESYSLDYALLNRPGIPDIQLDLFLDYRKNVDMYPQFQQYLRESNVPVLAAWGKNDIIFPPIGAELLKKDVKDLELHLLDAGHFLLETDATTVAGLIVDFMRRKVSRGVRSPI
jgi:pimeloyl-ACP methyl ester carboxylesterase